jgi:hypothetical protein
VPSYNDITIISYTSVTVYLQALNALELWLKTPDYCKFSNVITLNQSLELLSLSFLSMLEYSEMLDIAEYTINDMFCTYRIFVG